MPHRRVCNGSHACSDFCCVAKDGCWNRARHLAEAPSVVQVEQIYNSLQPRGSQQVVERLRQVGRAYLPAMSDVIGFALDLSW